MRAIAMHRGVFRASLGTRIQVTRCYSRWTSDDAAKPEEDLRSHRNSQQQDQCSRFTADDVKVKDDGSVHAPTPQDSAEASPFESTKLHHEVEDHFQEYRHRKQSSHSRAPVEEIQHDEEGKQVFGPQDRPPINYFTLSKKVYSFEGDPTLPVDVTEGSVIKAEEQIENLRRKAWGTLERIETEDGKLLYTRPQQDDLSNKVMRNDELFEISSALMDLDAWNNPNVRVYDASDEEAQTRKWSKRPRWQRVQNFVDDMEARVSESHASFDTLLRERHNPSRVTAWDIVSVALRGVNPDLTPSEAPKTMVEEASRLLDPREGNSLSRIIQQNGIPEQSQRRDTLLTDWMLMRKRRLAKQEEVRTSVSRTIDPDESMRQHERLLGEEKASQPPTLPRLEADTATALRRSVTGMLRSGLSYSSTIEYTCRTTTESRTSTLLAAIQDISRALSTSQVSGPLENSELLSFVASLLSTIPSGDTVSRLHLSWLGARLALTYDAWTTLHYLEQSLRLSSTLENGGSNAPAWEDLHFFVQKMNANMRSPAGTSWDVTKSNLASRFVRLYTGSSDDGYVDVESPSLRSLIAQHINFDHETKDQKLAERWLQTYDGYLEGLGYLGAARSIWAEWTSLDQLVKGGNHRSEDKQQLLDSFCRATRVLLENHSGSSDMDERTIRNAISGSLENWLDLLGEHGWRQTGSFIHHDALREDITAVSGA